MLTDHNKAAMRAIIEGLCWSTLVVAVLYATLPARVWTHNIYPAFSRRFDGGCNGWTRELAIWDMVQNIGLWYAYCTMATVIRRLHPVPEELFKTTHMLMVGFIVGCGFKHLVDAYTTLVPVYEMSIVVGYSVAGVSFAALWFISVSLHRARVHSACNRQQLQEFQNALKRKQAEA